MSALWGKKAVRGKLAILVPTYRFDSRARHTLASTASMASDDVEVVIADNSENPKKWQYLHRLADLHRNIRIFCHRTNIGAARNWAFLLEKSDLPYYLFVGDDDFCTPAYVEAGLQLLEMHQDASSAAGLFVMVSSANDMVYGNGARTEPTPYERCVNFRIGGGNTLPNSLVVRRAANPFLRYNQGHPLKASFFDWLLAYTILAYGKYYTQNVGHYLYDFSNWENAEACWRNNAKFYIAAGLPESFTWFHELYWAVEFAHFFRSEYSPISDRRQSLDCACFYYLNRIEQFRQVVRHVSESTLEMLIAQRPAAIPALQALISNDDALHSSLFDWFAEVLAAFDPTCAVAYRDYVQGATSQRYG